MKFKFLNLHTLLIYYVLVIHLYSIYYKHVFGGYNMVNELESRIKDALKDVKAWQGVPTSVNGVYLVKAPGNTDSETIMVEISPLNERGTSMKRKGLFLKSSSEFEGFGEIFKNENVMELLNTIEEINGGSKKKEVNTIEI